DKHLGPYEILSPLGAGGMGEVWRARDTRLNREVAIKVLRASFAHDAEAVRAFFQMRRLTEGPRFSYAPRKNNCEPSVGEREFIKKIALAYRRLMPIQYLKNPGRTLCKSFSWVNRHYASRS